MRKDIIYPKRPFKCLNCGHNCETALILKRHQKWCLCRDEYIKLYPESRQAQMRRERWNHLRRLGYDIP